MASIIEKNFSVIAEDLLAKAAANGMDAAEVMIRQECGFSVVARAGDIEQLEHHQEKNLVITVYSNQCSGSASAADFSSEAMWNTLNKAISIAKFTGSDAYAGLPDSDRQAYQYPDLNLHHEWSLTPRQAAEIAIECETTARDQDPAINDAEGATVSSYEQYFVYANSNGFCGGYPSTRHSIYSEVVAARDGQMQRDMEYSSARDPSDLLDHRLIAKKAVAKTLKRLDAQKITTRKCPIIFHADVAKGLLGSFVSAISGANLYRKSSFLLDCVGKPIFSNSVSLSQHPHVLKGLASAPFDAEGVKTREQCYVDEGVLTSYCLGSYSARQLGMESTGNSGGIFNLTMSTDALNFQSLLKKMDTGLLVTELMGQGVSILTGDYSRGAFGYWVEGGEIQYPVHEITIAGNLKQMFKSIVAVSNDVDSRGCIHTGSILIEEMMLAGH
jgi:PmbA protein